MQAQGILISLNAKVISEGSTHVSLTLKDNPCFCKNSLNLSLTGFKCQLKKSTNCVITGFVCLFSRNLDAIFE